MKLTLVLLFTFSFHLVGSGQHISGIYPAKKNPKAGEEISFFYSPPRGLMLPPKMHALITFEKDEQFYKEKVPVTKDGNRYSFQFKAPDSVAVLELSIINDRKNVLRNDNYAVEEEAVVDNNQDKGYLIYLHDKTGLRYSFAGFSLANLLRSFAIYTHQIRSVAREYLIELYEQSFKVQPSLKNKVSYANYLFDLHKTSPGGYKPGLLAYANEVRYSGVDEEKLLKAKGFYELFEDDSLAKETEKLILDIYPTGILAKENFWDSLDKSTNINEYSLLQAMDQYIKRFKDSSSDLRDQFYKRIFTHLVYSAKQYDRLPVHEKLISDKSIVRDVYNYAAWKLAGKGLDKPGTELETARIFSQRAIYWLESLEKSGMTEDRLGQNLQALHDMYINTYALVLYKLGEYDSAYYYQNSVYKKGPDYLDDAGYERLAAYMEKSKGPGLTRKFIEEQLSRGLNSARVLDQLKAIYKQLNIPEEELAALQNKNKELVKSRNIRAIRKLLGSEVAQNFVLKNLEAAEVSLNSFRNKIVVLDFWATWCSPCKASFPGMQKLINKYRADTNVVFLFIDTWERKSPEETRQIVSDYMKENKYSFNVLFDEQGLVAKAFRINAIPRKFIIDKSGNIVFVNENMHYDDDISFAIEAAKN